MFHIFQGHEIAAFGGYVHAFCIDVSRLFKPILPFQGLAQSQVDRGIFGIGIPGAPEKVLRGGPGL